MNRFNRWKPLVTPLLTSALVAILVSSWQSSGGRNEARAEPRRLTPQDPDQHFKSGGQRSEAVLQEILSVLKRMDERLARIEAAAQAGGAGQRVTRTVTPPEASHSSDSGPFQVRRAP